MYSCVEQNKNGLAVKTDAGGGVYRKRMTEGNTDEQKDYFKFTDATSYTP
jgi:hypothetical protein